MSERARRKPSEISEHAPHAPAEYDFSTVMAIQALATGTATAEQQVMALRWIVESGCKTYDLSYRPDPDGGDRATCFAEGKRFVGQQIVKLTKLDVRTIAESKDGRPREPVGRAARNV